MKRLILGGLLAAAAVGCGSAQAADVYDDTGAWYLAPMAQYTLLDTKRISRDNVGYQIGIGKDFARNWAAEIDASIGSFKIPGSGASQKLYGYSVDALYKFFPSSFFRPYLIGGFGVMEDSIGGHTQADHSPLAEGGIGLLTGIGSQTGATRLQFRTEAKYRTEFINARYFGPKQPGDVLLSAGIQVMFGAPVPEPPKPVVIPPKLDSDGDGVTDDIDRCPNTPAGAKVDQFGCEFDQDGDGVVDRLDQCPDTPRGTPVDAKGCPLDSDGDGVPDTIDKCPNTPKGDKVDSVGCTIKDEIKLHGVNFATDSADLVQASDVILSYGADTLKKYPNLVIEVRGHTDSRGSKKHNLLLSQRRAESVMRYLKEHGVTNTMTAKGYGQENPIADNRTEEGRLENRRVTLRIISGF